MSPRVHSLRIPDETATVIRGMHPELKKKIKSGLKAILEEPHTGKLLRNELTGLRSFRVSRFRIIYRVVKKEVEIVAVGPRIRIYEETYRLLQKNK
ncbi:MAG: type II toxin-antitoxin system RelE/ParE family toxin [Desulfobacterales bacterium]|nr:type II toxin-antitoxin system RelE/ParE family toxin [Desulfobacterales bacterium]